MVMALSFPSLIFRKIQRVYGHAHLFYVHDIEQYKLK